MDWHNLAMKRTELRRVGLESGEAKASSERMEDRMWRTQARQPSCKTSSTAAESVKRSNEDMEAPSVDPRVETRTEVDSDPANERQTERKETTSDH